MNTTEVLKEEEVLENRYLQLEEWSKGRLVFHASIHQGIALHLVM